jgi:hypothetical protein
MELLIHHFDGFSVLKTFPLAVWDYPSGWEPATKRERQLRRFASIGRCAKTRRARKWRK